jgi:hypothetical protein
MDVIGRAVVVTGLIAAWSAMGTATAVAQLPRTAEIAHKTAVGPGEQTVTWEGVGSGVLGSQDAMDAAGCQPFIHECYDALIEVKGVGRLTIKTSSTDVKAPDSDLQIFASDASGRKLGREIEESAAPTPTPDESVAVTVPDPRFYIVRIDYAIAVQGTVQAEAKFVPEAVEGVGSNATPDSAANAPKGSKIRSFSGTAKDDATVAKVEIGLLQLGKKKGTCKQLTSQGKFVVTSRGRCTEPTRFLRARGTTKWSYKLRRALPKGSYVLFSRATDNAGHVQAGFGSANRKRFRVR